ncbi:Type II secretion system protein C [Pseudidiomarina piscicola]|uniref:Type II secretion system protein C n=1 Tax=Pseudidiomarina piscicola TaxID=2614830 RepID=A0A6S6WRW7_9GAMM|nr:type II secretion system protein GspC [Pseudidiomarina piscicola]CAB0151149.1 Type II secretion system protein C [Pseudidiomarina piscicola]VZT40655.1 Type II secretion system protein C [Pseudomonas aeruginosa]
MQIQNPQLKRLVTLVSEPRKVRGVLWVVTALFAIYATWVLAQLTWQLLAPASEPASGPIQTSVSQQRQAPKGRVSNLAELNLFGTTTVQQSSSRAPKTNLNVRLLGVTASSLPERSAAIIEKDRNQEVYVIGDKLAGTDVTIEEIYADRVILNNSGILETLELEGIGELSEGLSLTLDNQQSAQRQTEPERPRWGDQVQSQQLSAGDRAAVRRARSQGAGALMDLIRIVPAMSGDGLQGYRLSPGNKPELFSNAGFKPGDIAVAINGQDLTEVASAQVAINELRQAQKVIVTVLRNDTYLDLELAVPNEQPNAN